MRVVDLSADFRLRDRGIYEDWYGEHGAPELFGAAVYGLPELHRERIAGADLVANPGCYPTAALLALAPLARAGLIGDVVDRRQVRRLGRRAASRPPATHFISADENMTPYKVGRHRHTPEIEQELAGQGARVTITFTPHLVPLAQGELVSCYVTPAREHGDGELAELYDDAYAREPFVELRDGPPGRARRARDELLPDLRARRRRTGPDPRFAAIDNLWKGAASQAVQNLNLMFGRATRREGLRDERVRLALGRAARARDRAAGRRARRGLPRRRRRGRHQAVRRPRPRRCSSRSEPDDGQRRALHALRRARRAGRCCASERCRLDALRAVVVNSGNANAATGRRGLEDAARMQGAGGDGRRACARTRSRSRRPA